MAPDRARSFGFRILLSVLLSAGALAVAPAAHATAWPIGVSANGRTFVDANGAPYLVVGDTAHHLMSALPMSSWGNYLTNRVGYGFNTVNFWGSCAHGNGGTTGQAQDGTYPFTSGTDPGSYDLSTPNDSYWVGEVGNFINMAAANGFTVMFLPVSVADYLGTFRNNGATKVFNFGVYIGTKFKNLPNVIYQDGNDFQTWMTASDLALDKAFMDGVESVDPVHIHGIQLNYQRSYSNQATGTLSTELKSDFVYTYYETYDYMLLAYASSPTLPTYLGESNYEGGNNTSSLSSPANPFIVRQEMWYAMTSGAAGHVWGNECVNHFDTNAGNCTPVPYPAALDTQGAAEVVYLPNLFQQFAWWNLVPDQAHAVVTGGYGNPAPDNLNLYNASYATTTWSPDGSLAITYTPVAHTLTVAMSQFNGSVRAQWYDPSNGGVVTISGSPFANSGTQSFTTPGANHDGDQDWVLVLDTTGGGIDGGPPPRDAGASDSGRMADAGPARDGGVTQDAGSRSDGSVSADGGGGGPAPDGGAPYDGAAPPGNGGAPSDNSSGCGCRTAPPAKLGGALVAILALALTGGVRRRRRRGS